MAFYTELLPDDIKERTILTLNERYKDCENEILQVKCKTCIQKLSSPVSIIKTDLSNFIAGTINLYRITKNRLVNMKDFDVMTQDIGVKEFIDHTNNVSDYNCFMPKKKWKKDPMLQYERISRLKHCTNVYFDDISGFSKLGKVAFEVDKNQCLFVNSSGDIPRKFKYVPLRKKDFEKHISIEDFIGCLRDLIIRDDNDIKRIKEILDFTIKIQQRGYI